VGGRWTDAEHDLVRSLSEDGHSAKEIAAATGRSIGMIYKKRAELGIRPTRCAHCRAELDLPSVLPPGRPPEYCDEECRRENEWAYEHNAIMEARPKTCAHCHAPLDLEQKVVRYCGRRCQQRAWWERARTDPNVREMRKGHRATLEAKKRAEATGVQSAVS